MRFDNLIERRWSKYMDYVANKEIHVLHLIFKNKYADNPLFQCMVGTGILGALLLVAAKLIFG